MKEVLEKVQNLLINLQPKIESNCYPGRAVFIDNYVDPALELIAKALAKEADAMVELTDAVSGEPVAWARNLTDPRPDTVTDLTYCSVAEHERGDTSRYIPLYTRPQAIAAIPEKKTGPIARTLEGYGYVNGWNACIDAMIGNRPEVKNAE